MPIIGNRVRFLSWKLIILRDIKKEDTAFVFSATE